MLKRRLWTIAACTIALAMVGAGCKSPSGENAGGTGEPTTTTTTTTKEPGGTSARKMPTAAGNTQSGDTIKIGLVASQNGELRPWGVDSINGVQLAIEETNNGGGVNGKKIELMIGDSASKPEQGKSAAEKLIADGALVILGEVASGITAQIAQSAFEKGVPVVAIGATRTDLTDIGANVFRVCYTDDFQGPVMAKFAYEELGLRKMAILTDNKQPYSVGLSNSFRAKFVQLGGEIVDEQFYESGQTQFGGQLTNLKAKNPDGLFLSGYFNEVGPIARQARGAGLNVKLLGGDGWDSRDLITSGGDAIIGGFFCNHYSNTETRPEVQDFLKKWRAKFGADPATTMGALGYDAAMLAIDAARRASALDSRALITALDETENFKGVTGSITLKGMNGNPAKGALVAEVTRTGFAARKGYTFDELR
jgi:branched-chain amino acid transport system substrate-binding protein